MSSKIVILGSGGVGGYFGARLAAAGNDVTFVARGAHFEAMRSNGLRVLSPLGDISLPEVEVVDSVDQIKRADFVFLTVSSGTQSKLFHISSRWRKEARRSSLFRTEFRRTKYC